MNTVSPREVTDDEGAAILGVLGTESGRRFVMMTLRSFNWDVRLSGAEPHQTHANAAVRDSALSFYETLEVHQPELVAKMIAEDFERRTIEEDRSEDEGGDDDDS